MGISKKEQINQLLQKNQGVVQISELVAMGITRQYATRYLQEIDCERVAKGIYISKDAWQDDLYILSLQYKKIVFSHETALSLHGLSRRWPETLHVTVPRDYKVNAGGFLDVKTYSVVESRYELGLSSYTTSYGHVVPCYDKERTICDIFRVQTEQHVKQYAMKEYLNGKRNLPLLMEYADALQVTKKIQQYLEVLL